MDCIPPDLLRSLRRLAHFDEPAFIGVHDKATPPVSVRFNPAKISGSGLPPELPFASGSQVPWASGSWYLDERPYFTQDPLFHSGLYYVQEASSMFLEKAFRACFPDDSLLRVLDGCAAPGGKSTQLQSLLSPGSLLVSNEVIKTRIPSLYQNMVRWGGANVVISQNDPKDFQRLPGFFDLLVIDAPCSGSGLFRKDPAAANGWSEDLVNLCSQRQQRIVADVWSALKDEGFLIYCTCSFSPEEDEDIVDEIISDYNAVSVRIAVDEEWKIVETKSKKNGAFGYRFYPDRLGGEGFFLSIVQKNSGNHEEFNSQRKTHRREGQPDKTTKSKPVAMPPSGWLPEGLRFLTINEMTHAIPEGQFTAVEMLKGALYLKKAGILCGKPGSGEWIPDHELALAAGTDIPAIPLHLEDARRYLRKELDSVAGQGLGWQVLSYGGLGLGWIKKLPNRINNYYPSSWRILGKP